MPIVTNALTGGGTACSYSLATLKWWWWWWCIEGDETRLDETAVKKRFTLPRELMISSLEFSGFGWCFMVT